MTEIHKDSHGSCCEPEEMVTCVSPEWFNHLWAHQEKQLAWPQSSSLWVKSHLFLIYDWNLEGFSLVMLWTRRDGDPWQTSISTQTPGPPGKAIGMTTIILTVGKIPPFPHLRLKFIRILMARAVNQRRWWPVSARDWVGQQILEWHGSPCLWFIRWSMRTLMNVSHTTDKVGFKTQWRWFQPTQLLFLVGIELVDSLWAATCHHDLWFTRKPMRTLMHVSHNTGKVGFKT